MTPRIGRLTTATGIAVLAVAIAPGLATPVPAAPDFGRATPAAVTGYILGGAIDALVEQNAHALTTLGVAGVSITPDGTDVAAPDQATERLVQTAHDNGLRAELLVRNYSDQTGDFDTETAGLLLRNPGNVRRVAAKLAGYVADQGWDGITVDLESLRRADGPGLVLLVNELQDRMAPEKGVSIDVMPSTSVTGYRDAGYRLADIAEAADLVVVMAYDLHGPGWSGPGPIGPLGWQRKVVDAILAKVPKDKVDLGVAGYACAWPRHRAGRTLSVQAARALVEKDGTVAIWKEHPGEWRAKLANGKIIWWSDGRSFRQRMKLAAEYALHGLALWRLGSTDTL